MSDPSASNRLHLPDLSIEGFRGIDRLSIPRLGRVTLLAGRNGVGKTTALDAVRVYAAQGQPDALNALLEGHDEIATALDRDRELGTFPDYAALFHGRDVTTAQPISISTTNGQGGLTIEAHSLKALSHEEKKQFAGRLPMDADALVLKVRCQDTVTFLPWSISVDQRIYSKRPQYIEAWPVMESYRSGDPAVPCESVGPGTPRNHDLARRWDKVALTEYESAATQALRLMLGGNIDRVAVIGDQDRGDYRLQGRRVVVKLKDRRQPVPLKSLGGGVTRTFDIALALANSRDVCLLIDEAENGIHYAVQQRLWGMILHTAHENNVQVLATTHSWDCVTGFARAAAECHGIEGALIRLDRDGEGVRAVRYSEEHLVAAAHHRVEVR